MSVEVWNQAKSNVAEVHVKDKLTSEDYEKFVPELEKLMADHDKIRLLVEMENFKGWSVGALWEDVKFDVKHFNDIDRVAFVGEKRWQEGMAKFCKPFTTADIRYYEDEQEEEARRWLEN